jgi:hypothetical protein
MKRYRDFTSTSLRLDTAGLLMLLKELKELKECSNVFYKFRALNRTCVTCSGDDLIFCVREYFLDILAACLTRTRAGKCRMSAEIARMTGHPSGMWVDAGRRLYVVDSQSNRVGVFQIRTEKVEPVNHCDP